MLACKQFHKHQSVHVKYDVKVNSSLFQLNSEHHLMVVVFMELMFRNLSNNRCCIDWH